MCSLLDLFVFGFVHCNWRAGFASREKTSSRPAQYRNKNFELLYYYFLLFSSNRKLPAVNSLIMRKTIFILLVLLSQWELVLFDFDFSLKLNFLSTLPTCTVAGKF